eukprot:CAMPEP_0173082514 /NCGR_PEP_ID=MMETSP1102-20130122/18348_1 /TAXON_ID=49646 /ORGANISM="Geminigera sp., Strain Caron Lab Isolate" /LENGTH=88 /DNA_ID=CAMNT_0013958169 /DNA_START=45 /DNA_END=311 /DNA_ORIENTATION=-
MKALSNVIQQFNVSVLQIVLQCVAVRCRVLHRVAVRCTVSIMETQVVLHRIQYALQYVDVCCSMLTCVAVFCNACQGVAESLRVLQNL